MSRRDPFRPLGAVARVEIVVRYDAPTFGRTIVLADPVVLELALDAVALADDEHELERLTECRPGALRDHGWRELARVAAQFTGAEGVALTRAFEGALALAPLDHDDAASRPRS